MSLRRAPGFVQRPSGVWVPAARRAAGHGGRPAHFGGARLPTTNTVVGGTSAFDASGSCTVGGSPLAGGEVWIWNNAGTVKLATITVDGSGNWSASGLVNGTYYRQYHPPLTHSLGDAEPDAFSEVVTDSPSFTISGASLTGLDFTAQVALYVDDMQGYADTTALNNYTSGIGHGSGPQVTQPINHGANDAKRFLDATGGPSGGKAMRFDYPDRTGTGLAANYSITAEAFWKTAQTDLSAKTAVYRRVVDKLETGWHCGDIVNYPGQTAYKYGYLNWGNGGSFHGLFLRTETNGHLTLLNGVQNSGGTAVYVNHDLGVESSWVGQYHTVLSRVSAINTPLTRATVYIDGVQISDNVASGTGTSGNYYTLQTGGLINNGPDHAQSRWIAHMALYASRPSLKAGV